MSDIEKTAETIDENVDNIENGSIADTTNEAEFTDTSEQDNAPADNGKAESKPEASPENNKPQKTNADYARERRKAEQEKAIKKARIEATIEALNGENPYTHEKMEDEADVQEYLTMREIEKSGKDPIADYSRFVKQKTKDEARQAEAKSVQEEWLKNDKKDFITKHPDVNLDELLSDETFRTFATGKVGAMPMSDIYTDYNSFIGKIEERARDRAAQVLANTSATPGKLSTNNTPPPAKSYSEMSSAEFEKVVARVKRGERIS
jgi:hypothetical protein